MQGGASLDLDEEEFTLRKRLPPRLPVRANDVYVSEKTNFKAQEARCLRLLERGVNEVVIHGLGKAVHRALTLALKLQSSWSGSLSLATHTASVTLTDDLVPTADGQEARSQHRTNASVHIRVYRCLTSEEADDEAREGRESSISSDADLATLAGVAAESPAAGATPMVAE